MSFCQLMVPGVRSFLVFSSFGFRPPASGVQFILIVASRLLYPYRTNDKTSRLMVKRFSIVGETQRGSQSYMEKRRGKGEIEMARRRRGGIKRGESNLASNQFPIFSTVEHSERFTEFHKEKREEGDRGDQEEKRRSLKERARSS